MTNQQTVAPATLRKATKPAGGGGWVWALGISIGPLLAALALGGLVLLAMGVNPFAYYGYVVHRAILSQMGLEATLTRMAALPTRRAQSRSPAPMDWPTRVVPALASPTAGM